MQLARCGQNEIDGSGLIVRHTPAAKFRADAILAARIHEARVLEAERQRVARALTDDQVDALIPDESAEAEAGRLLMAEEAEDINRVRVIADAWLEANRKK